MPLDLLARVSLLPNMGMGLGAPRNRRVHYRKASFQLLTIDSLSISINSKGIKR